jgi:hypothetical protein
MHIECAAQGLENFFDRGVYRFDGNRLGTAANLRFRESRRRRRGQGDAKRDCGPRRRCG